MVKIYALGGSGEDARNCFALETETKVFLLDCGVKREIFPDKVGEYPVLTPALVKKLTAVFLSHAHEDHCAALPLLYHLGYRGKIYATQETCGAVPGFVKKWMNFVRKNKGTLPYTEEDAALLQFATLEPGKSFTLDGLQVETGRSGHLAGSLWFRFTLNHTPIFYSGDLVIKPQLMLTDPPLPAPIAILDSAYAGRQIDTAAELQKLLAHTAATVAQKGKEILPVPVKGRSADMYLFLTAALPHVPFYVDKEIMANLAKAAKETAWLKPLDYTGPAANVTVIEDDEARSLACAKEEGAVFLTQDGMLTQPQGLYYFDRFKADPHSEIIISGHAAGGTPGSLLFDEAYCAQNKITIRKGRITLKVHMDDDDLLAFNTQVKAKTIILFHSQASHTTALRQKLQAKGVAAYCLAPGEFLEV